MKEKGKKMKSNRCILSEYKLREASQSFLVRFTVTKTKIPVLIDREPS